MEYSIEELAKYRFECSLEALEDAQIMYKAADSKEEADAQIKRAEIFIQWIRDYLTGKNLLEREGQTYDK